MKIYRYDVATADLCDDRKPWGTMHSSDTGEYVKYSDVERLQARIDLLESCIRSGMTVYTGNGHPDRAKAELWDHEARAALSATGEGK